MVNKRENIVNAAVEVFREKGIDKTKISDIVKIAGIAQGTFYLYFPSKLSLMPAIAEVMVDITMTALKETVQEDAPFETKLEQIVDAIFLVCREYNELQALIYAGLASTEHLKEWETVYEPVYKWMGELLIGAKEAGLIRQAMHIDHTVKIMIGLVESAAEQIYLYDLPKEDMARVQKSEVTQFLKHALGVNV